MQKKEKQISDSSLGVDKYRITIENLDNKKEVKKVVEVNGLVLFTGKIKDPLAKKPDIIGEMFVLGQNIIIRVVMKIVPQFMNQFMKKNMVQRSNQPKIVN